MGVPPSAGFALVDLDIVELVPSDPLARILGAGFSNPLGYGKSPSRFSDPRSLPDDERFGVLYLGSSLKVCFLETLLRDARDGLTDALPMAEIEIIKRSYAKVEASVALRLIDLTGDGGVRMGVPSDVCRATDQTLARDWSLAFQQHPTVVDGICYPSRLNGSWNFAVYDRAVPKLTTTSFNPLIDAPELDSILTDLKVSLV